MLIKFIKRGTGDAKKAAAYVLADTDHAGLDRAGVAVLRGDPDQVARVANSLSFVHRYSSGVIAWHPDDKPTAGQIDETLNEVERIMFAGLDPSRFAWTAVQHLEPNGSTHIHILIARVDLDTGLSYNPAPPGWEDIYGPIQSALNYKYAWARPEDPMRARFKPAPDFTSKKKKSSQTQETDKLLEEVSRLSTKEELIDKFVEIVKFGFGKGIDNRDDLVSYIKKMYEVRREGKDYITVVVGDKSFRLKGGIFARDAKYNRLVFFDSVESPRTKLAKPSMAAIKMRKHEELIKKRADFNLTRYSRKENPNVGNTTSNKDEDTKNGIAGPGRSPEVERRDSGSARAIIDATRAVAREIEREIQTARSAVTASGSVDDAIGRALQSLSAADDAHRAAGGPVSKCLQAVGRALERIADALGRARREVMSRLDRSMASSKQVDRPSSHIPRPPRSPFDRPKPKPD
jgi:hypothetical protein